MLGPVPAELLTLLTLARSLFADLRCESSVFCNACAVERRKNTERGGRGNVGIRCGRKKAFPGKLGPAQNLLLLFSGWITTGEVWFRCQCRPSTGDLYSHPFPCQLVAGSLPYLSSLKPKPASNEGGGSQGQE